ncbi:MAG: Asp-tRNA(Asn)/Glu-tRNA(Gln) amidotransferase subunit GatC [Candidatus Gastranaerophilales bacterium]|nr:Asp-tRNA(Asn)/Glu-tRNA(Gln) amidotransferase subunit GatC [Candidatus Gastranaerophilales bacterium]
MPDCAMILFKIIGDFKPMISTDDVKHVAKLARLELTAAEVAEFSKQLGDILKYVEQMNEVDTTNVEPMTTAIPIVNVMREDVVKYEQTREELMANAPVEEDGFFKVPKIN